MSAGFYSVCIFQLLGAITRHEVIAQGLGAVMLMMSVMGSGFPIARSECAHRRRFVFRVRLYRVGTVLTLHPGGYAYTATYGAVGFHVTHILFVPLPHQLTRLPFPAPRSLHPRLVDLVVLEVILPSNLGALLAPS